MFQNEFFNPNWDTNNNTMDQNNDPFESALSSMVSSPTATTTPTPNNDEHNNTFQLRELIGRLGSICNNSNSININSTNNSCYSTPLNSPPKLNLSVMMENQYHHHQNFPGSLTPLSGDPGFAERAARYSCFASNNMSLSPHQGFNPNSDPVNNITTTINHQIFSGSRQNAKKIFCDSMENSSSVSGGDIGSRKRKSAASRGKGKDSFTPLPAKDQKHVSNEIGSVEKSESSGKRSKSDDDDDRSGIDKGHKSKTTSTDRKKDNNNSTEGPKDYIHVRARRGQATDAHSLAERVRREKIGERMKLLQDLVPGCDKVTGKAVMLDEIINYVQSLQRQVEFLSMKLATVNPRMDLNMDTLMPKDMYQSRGSLPQNMYPSDSYPFQPQPNFQTCVPNGVEANNFNAGVGKNQLPCMENFSDAATQASTFWGDDLHSIVQMGFGQNQTQKFPGILPTAQMKVEL